MKIRDVMTPDIDVVTCADTLKTAVELMADLDFDALPVIENNRLIGTIASRDIAIRVVAEGSDPKEARVGQAVIGDALYCFAEESVPDVAQKMAEWWVTRLPVVDQDRRPIGMISLGDLTARNLHAKRVRTLTRKPQRVCAVGRTRRARPAVAAA